MTTCNKLEILQYDIPFSWLQYFKIACCQCSTEFSSFEKENFHRPVLLSCSHVACELCVGRVSRKFYKCRICNEATYFDVSRDIRLQTTFNEYLDGLLNFKKHVISYRRNFFAKKPITTIPQNKQECFECNSKASLKFCLICEVIYCSQCFTLLHKGGKVLRNHRYTVPDALKKDEADSIKPVFCNIHYNEMFNIFCKDCKETCCMKCSNDKHPNHDLSSIRDENIKCKGMVDNVIALISTSRKENENSKLKLEEFSNCHNKYLTEAIENITKQFVYLHGILQNLELEYIGVIKESYKEIINELNVVDTTLTENENLMIKKNDKLHTYKLEIPQNEYILSELQQTMKVIQQLPVTVNFHKCPTNPISFTEIKSFKNDVKSYFNLDVQKNLFKIFWKTGIDPSNQLLYDRIDVDRELTSKIDSIDITSSTAIGMSQNSRITDILNKHYIKNKKTETINMPPVTKPKNNLIVQQVHVSYIKSAGHFYVQNESYLKESTQLREMCNAEGNEAHTIETVELDQMYLIFSRTENEYYRGIVTNTNEGKNCYTVFYVDYGRTEKLVKSKRIRAISAYLIKQPKGARLCSLFNIQSCKKPVIEQQQVQVMSDIIANQPMTMITLFESNGKYHVDLFNSSENRISLRDALIFCEMVQTHSSPESAPHTDKIKHFEDYKREFIYSKAKKRVFRTSLKVGEYFKILVKHIVSPEEFYVIKVEHAELIDKMNRDLNEFYGNKRNYIYFPQVNTNCVAFGYNNLWHRAKIINILPDKLIEVYLIDIGIKQLVTWKNLMYLDHSFFAIDEGVVKCRLVNVQPQKVDNYIFSDSVLNKFKELTLSSNLHINIQCSGKDSHDVNLYIMQGHKEFCINELLNNNDSTITTEETVPSYFHNSGSVKNFDMTILSNIQARCPNKDNLIRRTKLSVLNIISPSEFYICLNEFLPGLKKLHINIQKLMENNNEAKRKPNWIQNEKCFVITKLDKNMMKQWYRGIIQSPDKNDKEKFVIFIRDKGCFVTEHHKNIVETDPLLGNIGNGSLQCSLSCVQPTGGQKSWPSYAIDEFRYTIQAYQELALSLYGPKIGQCYKIILWGLSIECEDALAPAEVQWNNINMILVDNGVGHLTEKFVNLDQEINGESKILENTGNDINAYLDNFEKQLKQITDLSIIVCTPDDAVNSTTVVDPVVDLSFSATITPISSWLKSERIEKSQFLAIVTYVDNDAVMYLHDLETKNTMDQITKLINDKYKNSKSDAPDSSWTVGQPCIAKYHLDKLYYRAKILEILSPTIIQIEFIDYGNIEECSPSDLRANVILGHVPIQARKYCLKNIVPVAPNWSVRILDIIHAKIVTKICVIRTDKEDSENVEIDIVPCQLTVGSTDLAKYLIDEKIAMVKNLTATPIKICERFRSNHHVHNEFSDIYNDISINKKDGVSYRSIKESRDVLHDLSSSSDVIILSDNDGSNDENDDDELVVSFDETHFETSTQYIQLYEFSPFNMVEIQRDVHGFQGTVMKCLSSTNIILSTKQDKLIVKYKQMMDTIQLNALKSETIKNISIGITCIAWNQVDNLWHRGIIKAYNHGTDLFNILLVDKMETIKVKSDRVKKCPSGCHNYPLLYLKVILNRVKPNPRLRETDIVNKISALLVGKIVYVKIIRFKSKIPIVELYNDNKCEIQVYQSMILENFLQYK